MTTGERRWPHLALHAWTLWALAAAPLLDLLRRHPEFLIAHDIGARRLAWLLAICLIALPLPTVALARAAQRGRAWAPLLLSPPVFLLGLYLAVRAGLGVAALPLALAAATAQVWAYRRFPALGAYLSWLTPVALVAPLTLAALTLGLWRPAAPLADGTAPRPGAPVVLLILDELPVATLLDQDGALDSRRFPNLAAMAQDAHWFDNVVSVDSSTPKAVSAILAGTQLGAGQLPVARDLPVSLFTLLAPAYRVAALEPVTRICPPAINILAGNQPEAGHWLGDTAIAALHLFVPRPWADRLPPIDSQWAGFGNPAVEVAPVESAGSDDGTNWKQIFAQAGRAARSDRLAGFERLLESIDGRRRGVLYFGHLLLPHRPWAYLPSGSTYWPRNYREPRVFQEKAWPESPSYAAQAYQRHLLQAQFTDRLIGRLIERLREQGIYDEALIAITADHGISFLPSEMKRGVTPANRQDVLQVPLLLKLPRQSTAIYHPEARSTLDLLPTLLAALAVEAPTGRSLFSVPSGSSAAAPTDSPWRAALDRRTELFGLLDGPLALFDDGPNAEWLGRSLTDIAPTDDRRFTLELEAPGYEFTHTAGAQPVPVWVYGRLAGPIDDRAVGLAVVVDGVVRATTVYDPADRSERFRALLPESALAAGRHELSIVVIDPETGRGLLPARR